jgi:glycosyltransferase involved in cell wall biosynthesis
MNPKTVVIICNVDWYFNLHWLHRANAIIENGWSIHLITTFTDNKIKADLQALGITCHNQKIRRHALNPFINLIELFQIGRIVWDVEPSLIHGITIKPNIYGGLLAKLKNIPAIKSITGLGIIFSGQSLMYRILRPLIRALFKVTSSNNHQYIFENIDDLSTFKDSNISRQENLNLIRGAGIELSEFSHVPIPKVGNTFRLLFAGRLLFDKGLQDLVLVTSNMRLHKPKIELIVAGIPDPESRGAIPELTLDNWAKNGLIQWQGKVNDMQSMISSCHAVCLPTKYGEGLPRILLEAASVGRPLIATDVQGCRDIVIDGLTGILIPINDLNKLSQAIETLCHNEEMCKSMGLAGRHRVEEHFSNQLIIAQTMRCYEKACESRL